MGNGMIAFSYYGPLPHSLLGARFCFLPHEFLQHTICWWGSVERYSWEAKEPRKNPVGSAGSPNLSEKPITSLGRAKIPFRFSRIRCGSFSHWGTILELWTPSLYLSMMMLLLMMMMVMVVMMLMMMVVMAMVMVMVLLLLMMMTWWHGDDDDVDDDVVVVDDDDDIVSLQCPESSKHISWSALCLEREKQCVYLIDTIGTHTHQYVYIYVCMYVM